MVDENFEYKVYIDRPLKPFQDDILSIFEALRKIPCESFYFYFLTESKSDGLQKHLINVKNEIISLNEEEKDFIEQKFENLLDHVLSTNVSFSWGFLENEFVFIIFSDLILLDIPSALIGLVLHEVLHGLERQRGLEDDLKRSLDVTMQTFTEMATLIPKYDEKDLTTMLRTIGEFTIYVLKDLYVNREAIERGFAKEILSQYKYLFQIESNDGPSPVKFPKLELYLENFDKEKTIDLIDFEKAFVTLLGLTTAWLPFIRLSSGYETQQALEIKEFINETYNKVCIISERFRHLENVYLTEFTYTNKFHQKWFSEVFSIIIDILSCGEFIIWQFSHLTIKLEQLLEDRKKTLQKTISDDQESYTIKDLILIPVLKSAYLFSRDSTLTSITKEIHEKLEGYLNEEELKEWEQYNHEYSMEHLLLFVLSELVQLLRKKFLMSIFKLRTYTGLVLDVLELLTDIKEDIKFFDRKIYLNYKDQIIRFITTRDSRFMSLKIIFPLEFEILKDLNGIADIEDDIPFTPEEATEFLMLMRFFALPKLNWVLELSKRFAKIMKLNLKHANDPASFDIEVIALTSVMLIKNFEEEEINKDLLIPIYRATLMALKLPMFQIKAIVHLFGNLLRSESEDTDQNKSEVQN